MGMHVSESALLGGAVDGAMVLGEIEMEQAEKEGSGKEKDQALFHGRPIIP